MRLHIITIHAETLPICRWWLFVRGCVALERLHVRATATCVGVCVRPTEHCVRLGHRALRVFGPQSTVCV